MFNAFVVSLLIFLIGTVAFVGVPLAGALHVWRGWKQFRDQVLASLDIQLYNPADPDFHPPEDSLVRFYGILDSMEGEDYLWVRNGSASMRVKVGREWVYMLPGNKAGELGVSIDSSIRRLRWERTGILAEGAGLFVLGNIRVKEPVPLVYHGAGQPFLLILYDGRPRHVMGRSIWFGRSRNEFWNSLTPPSLLMGTGLLLALAVMLFRTQLFSSEGIWAISFALVPYLVLMPPGILGYFLYRRLWKQAKLHSARKDLFFMVSRMKGSPVLRRNCAYDEVQVLPGTATAEALARQDDLPRVNLAAGRSQVGILSWFKPRLGSDPSGEAYLFEGLGPQQVHKLNRRILRRTTWALLVFIASLGANFILVLYLLVQFVLIL